MGHYARLSGHFTLRPTYLLDRSAYATTRLSLYTATLTDDTNAVVFGIPTEVSANIASCCGNRKAAGHAHVPRELAPHDDQDESPAKHHVDVVPIPHVQAQVQSRVGSAIWESLLPKDNAGTPSVEAPRCLYVFRLGNHVDLESIDQPAVGVYECQCCERRTGSGLCEPK